MPQPPALRRSEDPQGATTDSSAAAIRRLAEQGYEATTAGDLADAVGMSRSTFFRRFRSKDDVIFADHDHALARLDEFLRDTPLEPRQALVRGTADVLRHLVRDPQAARLRFDLMRETPALRDRELVITHRYERVFRRYLRDALPSETPIWVPAALAAVLVSVHNSTLREWLRGGVTDAPRTATRDLEAAVGLFSHWFGTAADAPSRSVDDAGSRPDGRVAVAVFDAASSPEQILQAITARLERT